MEYSKLIGTPYSEKDCWGIVVEFYRLQFKIELNQYYQDIPKDRDASKAMVYSNIGDFYSVSDRAFGDIFLVKLYGVECHIAIYLGEGLMLHTTNHSGCVIDRVARWEKLIVGTYRVVGDK